MALARKFASLSSRNASRWGAIAHAAAGRLAGPVSTTGPVFSVSSDLAVGNYTEEAQMSVAARTVKPGFQLVKANEQRLRDYTANTLKKCSEKEAAQLTGLPLGQVKALRTGMVTPSFETGHYLCRMDPTFAQRFADLMAGRWIPAVEDASPHAVAAMIDTTRNRKG